MTEIKIWLKYNKVPIYVAMFFIGLGIIFLSSVGWGVGFLGWRIVLALFLVFPLVYDMGKVSM